MILLALSLPARAAAPIAMQSEADAAILAAFLRQTDALPRLITPEALDAVKEAEALCWSWSGYFRMPLIAYRLTADPRHLRTFVTITDTLLTRTRMGPDGYLGFRGIPLKGFQDPENPTAECDVNITEFTFVEIFCDFVEIVRADPALAKQFDAYADRYLALATDHLAGLKWDIRGDYVDLGSDGAVFRMAAENGPHRSLLTDPNNKQSKMCRAYLALYRVTKNDEYFKRAIKLGYRFKSTLQLDGERYLWHYWDPAGDWDRKPDAPGEWRHWIGPEHRDGYHALTLEMAVALYDHGVVFDAEDIRRFTNTQMQVSWNGSIEEPVFKNTAGRDVKEPDRAKFIAPALDRFDPRIQAYLYGDAATSVALALPRGSWTAVKHGSYLAGKYLAPRTPEPQQDEWREEFLKTAGNKEFLAQYNRPAGAASAAPLPRRTKMGVHMTSSGVQIRDDDMLVLNYQASAVKLPDGVRTCGNFIHPLNGLDGEPITELFPADHPHHRGIFWAWHQIYVGETAVGDSWECKDFIWDAEGITPFGDADGFSGFRSTVLWKSPLWREGKEAFVREELTVFVNPVRDNSRAIDFVITLNTLVDGVKLGGSNDIKGYGGFTARIFSPPGATFTGQNGPQKPQTEQLNSGAWVNITATGDGSSTGVAIMQHPSNPQFPQPWLLREGYRTNMQNPAWPGSKELVALEKDKPIRLNYRLLIHRGVDPSVACKIYTSPSDGYVFKD